MKETLGALLWSNAEEDDSFYDSLKNDIEYEAKSLGTRFLQEHGSDVNAQAYREQYFETPLHQCLNTDALPGEIKLEIVTILASSGELDVTIENGSGDTALDLILASKSSLAARYKSLIAKVIISHSSSTFRHCKIEYFAEEAVFVMKAFEVQAYCTFFGVEIPWTQSRLKVREGLDLTCTADDLYRLCGVAVYEDHQTRVSL